MSKHGTIRSTQLGVSGRGPLSLKSPLATICLLAIFLAAHAAAGRAQTETVLYTFTGGTGGGGPYAGLIADANGNFYGTASSVYGGGPCDTACGVIFELTRTSTPAADSWAYNVLYTFQGGEDGAYPCSTLAIDDAGSLYGTTINGGTGCGPYGCGTVFELKPTTDGWRESVLFRFTGGSDGNNPFGPVTLDGVGNIYGAAAYGGDNSCYYDGVGCGVVFRLNRPTGDSGEWTETVLHTFEGTDGAEPFSGVILAPTLPDTASAVGPPGTVYGTTLVGGPGLPNDSGGLVFRIVPSAGSWDYQILYEFPQNLGRPGGPPVFDKSGNLYGMAGLAGSYGVGAVFELTPPKIGQTTWQESNIYNFTGPPNGWISLYQGVVMDGDETIYATTSDGGTSDNCEAGCGTVFRLSKSGDGWFESGLYSLPGGAGGQRPFAGVPVVDRSGHLYGMTLFGGDPSCSAFDQSEGCGVIYEISK